jgi:hypothetical protein
VAIFTPDAREGLRRRYRPVRVRLLFVGESPPASGRFFYQADSGLYRAVRRTFITAFPELENIDFLDAFRALDCYLVDLCGRPVDRMDRKERAETCDAGEIRLSRMIRQLRPKIIVTLVRSIAENVRRAESLAGWRGERIELPYPGRWKKYRIEFAAGLTPVLQRQLRTKMKKLARAAHKGESKSALEERQA